MVWLLHQLLWNPEVDVDHLRTQYCNDLFGPVAEDMQKFFAILEDRWEKAIWTHQPTRVGVDFDLLYQQTYPPEVIQRLKDILAAAIAKVPVGSVYDVRMKWFADEYAAFFEESDKFKRTYGVIPKYQAFLTDEKINIDGKLEENIWHQADPLLLVLNTVGASTKEKTEVRVTWDYTALYIGAKMEKKDASDLIIKTENKEDNNSINADRFIIFFRKKNQQSYSTISVNSRGVISCQSSGTIDDDMLQEVSAASSISGDIWSVELAIPWSIVSNKKTPIRSFRVQFGRAMHNEKYCYGFWSPTWSFPGELSLKRFGEIEFVQRQRY